MTRNSGLGISIFLGAVGAILAFAVDLTVQGFDLKVMGVILMVVAVIGVAISLIAGATHEGDRTVIRDREVIDRSERDTRERDGV